MENFAIIAIAAFIAILVLGPILMVYLTRWSDQRKYHPGPRAFERASAKLREAVVVEKDATFQLAPGVSEPVSCPICLAELYPISDGREQVKADRVGKPREYPGTDESASHGAGQASSRSISKAQEQAHNSPTSTVDEIVSLKSCGHSFHSRCLTTWFMIDRLDCPVCRARYWGEAHPDAGRPVPDTNRPPGRGRRIDEESSGVRTGYWGVVVL